MTRSILLIVVGAVGGSIVTWICMDLQSEQSLLRGGPVMGPVGIIAPGARDRGYLGVEFSNEPGRSLFIVDVRRRASPMNRTWKLAIRSSR